MNNIYLISDMHLGHEKAALARGFTCVEEHDEELIKRHNDIVKPKDTVYNLGDVVFNVSAKLDLLHRLNGLKRLILGNHEHFLVSRYSLYFAKIYSTIKLKDRYILTHIPIHPQQFNREHWEFLVNVHGHIHIDHESTLGLNDPRYFNVNCEYHDLSPVHIDDLEEMIIRQKMRLEENYVWTEMRR